MRIATGILAALLASTSAFADQPVLRSDILVRSDVVTLGDMIDGLGEKGNVSVFAAPALGRSGTIQLPRILEAARENGITSLDTADLSQVTVRRAGRLIAPESVTKAVTDAIIGEYGLPASIEIALDPSEGFFVEPNARIGLRVRSLELDRTSGRFTADLVSHGAATGTSFKVSGLLADEIEVPVLARDMQRSTPIDVADIVIEKRPRRDLPEDAIFDPAMFAQMMVNRSFRAGSVLRKADIAAMPLVTRGDLVTLIVEIDGMTLSTRGKALQGGTAGTVITVQNLQTKRSLSGTIAGPGKVIISVNQTAQLAASTN